MIKSVPVHMLVSRRAVDRRRFGLVIIPMISSPEEIERRQIQVRILYNSTTPSPKNLSLAAIDSDSSRRVIIPPVMCYGMQNNISYIAATAHRKQQSMLGGSEMKKNFINAGLEM